MSKEKEKENSAVKSIFNKVKKQNSDLKNKNEVVELDKDYLNKEEVLSNYNFDYEVEEETLEFLKEQTYQIHLTSNVFYTKLGKIFIETQEKLANNKNGVFRKWFESIGFKKDFVYENISRYKYIVGKSDDIKNEIEALPVSLSYEIAKESCPEYLREKVLAGEIKSKAELKKAIKETMGQEEVQEAEIVEDFEEEIKMDFEVIKQMIAKVEKTCDYSNENFEILEKIKKMLSKME